jgi:hypothetical protein
MASHMTTFCGRWTTQVNEKSRLESSLNLTLTQHPRDEDPELWKVCFHFKSWTPSNLVLSHLSKFLHLGDFVASQPGF